MYQWLIGSRERADGWLESMYLIMVSSLRFLAKLALVFSSASWWIAASDCKEERKCKKSNERGEENR